ncbi:MAG: 50S ribosomal protein L7 [Ruminococcaceae bacterium]|nr:50S ribosomal protein L7 [Oscillospiraceae bacterium]
MNDRLNGLLGMTRRAGRLVAGFDATVDSIKARRAQLVLLAADLSQKTEKELRFTAGDAVPLLSVGLTKEEIGHAAGYGKPVGVVATEDKGFAAAIIKAADCRNKEDAV